MAANCGYIKSLVALLKIASIILLVIAYSTGMHAYLGSNYNKDCMNPTPTTRKPLTFSTPSVLVATHPRRQNTVSSTTEEFIVTLPTQPTFDTTTPPKTGCDKAPILWMERVHLITTGTCVMLSVIMLLLHLVKRDLSEHSKFRGIDFGYHFFGAIWLIVSAVFMTYSASKIDDLASELCSSNPESCQLMKEKIIAAGFAFLSGICFIVVAMKTFGKKFYQTV